MPSPLRAETSSPEKCPVGLINMNAHKFFVCGPKFTNFFRLKWNVGGVVDHALFQIFVMWIRSGDMYDEIESCQKSFRILDVFAFLIGGGPPESCTKLITRAFRHIAWKSFGSLLPLFPKL